MKSGTKLRLVLTVLFTPFLVVGYLNIEKLAEKKGWDGILSRLEDKMPAGLSGFIISPFMAMVSALVVGIVIGLWSDTFIRKLNSRGSKVENLGLRIQALANTIDSKFHANVSFDDMATEVSKCIVFAKKMTEMGFVVPSNVINAEPWQERLGLYSRYFKMMGAQMEENSKKDAIEFSKALAEVPVKAPSND